MPHAHLLPLFCHAVLLFGTPLCLFSEYFFPVAPSLHGPAQCSSTKHLWYFLNVFILFIYLFIILCIYLFLAALGLCCARAFSSCDEGATLRCDARAYCGGFFCCGARAPGTRASVVVVRRLYSAGSVVVAHGLSCSTVCGIFPDQGLNPCPLHWQEDS